MRYITKELYRASQIGCYFPEPLSEAAEFSEALFQRLFCAKVDERLARWTEACRRRQEKGLDTPPLDEETVREQVEKSVQLATNHLRRYLPEEILLKVADLRVLALGAATPEVVEMIRTRKREIHEEWEKKNNDYIYDLHYLMMQHPNSFLKEFSFHDALISTVRRNGSDFEIEFDREDRGFYTPIVKIRFENCRELQMDEGIEGKRWLYTEVFGADRGFEIYIMVEGFDEEMGNEVAEMHFFADDVKYEYREL